MDNEQPPDAPLLETSFELSQVALSEDLPTKEEQNTCQCATKTSQKSDSVLLAWSQVLVSFLIVVNGFGYLSSFGLFQAHWQAVLNRSASDVSWVGSLQLFLLFFVGTISGRLVDAGYFRSLIITGCALQLLGTFTTSFVTQYWQLILSQGIVQGLGNGILFTPLVTLVSVYFPERRAFALGVTACGAPVGGVIFPTVRVPTLGFAIIQSCSKNIHSAVSPSCYHTANN